MVSLIQTLKEIKGSLFRKHVELKIHLQDQLPWTIIGKDIKLQKFQEMYNGYHLRYKFKFIKPLVYIAIYLFSKLNKTILGKSFIPTEKISVEPCNKVINIANETMIQTLKESTLIFKKDVEGYNEPMKRGHNQQIKTVFDLLMQHVMYDTFYRGVFEMYIINLTININKAYAKDKTHVLYNKKTLDNIDYLAAVGRNNGNHLVIRDSDGFIVIPKGQAIKIQKQDIEQLLKDINNLKKKK